MAADVNEAPKEEDPSVPRGCDRKEEKEGVPMKFEWGGRGRTIASSSASGQGIIQKGDTKEGKEEEEELLKMSNQAEAMEEAVAKAIADTEERHRFDKESL